MKTIPKSECGFTLVEVMIVVAIIGMLAAIAIPNFARARQTSQVNACINNLRQLDAAIQEYALENNAAAGDTVVGDMVAPYLPRGINTAAVDIERAIFCPIDGNKGFSTSYAGGLTTVDTPPRCVLGGALTPAHTLP